MKYRSKLATINAIQWNGTIQQLLSNVPISEYSWFALHKNEINYPIERCKNTEYDYVVITSRRGGDKLYRDNFIAFYDDIGWVQFDCKVFKEIYKKVSEIDND